jgi:hypothetical protein
MTLADRDAYRPDERYEAASDSAVELHQRNTGTHGRGVPRPALCSRHSSAVSRSAIARRVGATALIGSANDEHDQDGDEQHDDGPESVVHEYDRTRRQMSLSCVDLQPDLDDCPGCGTPHPGGSPLHAALRRLLGSA